MADDELLQPGNEPIVDIGADIIVDAGQDNVAHETEIPEQTRKLSVRESIDAAVKEVAEKQETGKPEKPAKPSRQDAAAPGPKAGEQGSKPGAAKPATPAEAPVSWTAEEKTLWSQLPSAVQAAVHRRESEMQKGVEKIKTQYRDLDNVIGQYDGTIRQFGFTRSQAVDQLFKWQMWLAGPQKIEAFRALMQSHGVDPATVAGAPVQAAPGGAHTSGIPSELNTVLSGIVNRLDAYDQQSAAQTRAAAETSVMAWAKDKPHFEKVRQLMGQLIQSGAVPNLESGHPDLDGAYERAIYADPEIRALVLAEERAKQTAANKALIDGKRKAGSSMRVGSPTGGVVNGAVKQSPKNESVRDSIRRALSEVRQ